MKYALVGLLVFSLGLAAGSARALDDLDELLSGDSAVAAADSTQDNLVNPGTVELRSSATGNEARAFSDHLPWSPSLDKPGADLASDTSQPLAHRPAAATDISLVPEPSAVALAALALCYFLIFGRRRPWR